MVRDRGKKKREKREKREIKKAPDREARGTEGTDEGSGTRAEYWSHQQCGGWHIYQKASCVLVFVWTKNAWNLKNKIHLFF